MLKSNRPSSLKFFYITQKFPIIKIKNELNLLGTVLFQLTTFQCYIDIISLQRMLYFRLKFVTTRRSTLQNPWSPESRLGLMKIRLLICLQVVIKDLKHSPRFISEALTTVICSQHLRSFLNLTCLRQCYLFTLSL